MANVARRVGCSDGFMRTGAGPTSIIRRWYQHSALKWARENPKIAQECLNPPPLIPTRGETQSVNRLHSLKQIQCFDDYWRWRRWEFPVESEAELEEAKALASHVLSAPLTLATQLLTPNNSRNLSESGPRKQQQQWCCIGARAEAGLPLEFWKEMLVLGTAFVENDAPLHLTLDFIGPEIVQRPPVQLDYEESTLNIRWLFAGKFHEWVAVQQVSAHTSSMALESYDAYILLNPGLGHAHLKEDWKPTLDLLLTTKSAAEKSERERHPTILLTAHSQLDTERDAALLTQELSSSSQTKRIITYEENPFASRIDYQDPFDTQHLVRSNHYLVSLH
jgi:hypothetical protein